MSGQGRLYGRTNVHSGLSGWNYYRAAVSPAHNTYCRTALNTVSIEISWNLHSAAGTQKCFFFDKFPS
jgi:hypothetical protein